MEADLLKYLLRGCGLGERWCHILKKHGILTIEDLKQNLCCPGIIDLLQLDLKDEEVAAFSNLISKCKSYKMEDNTEEVLHPTLLCEEADRNKVDTVRSATIRPEYQCERSDDNTEGAKVLLETKELSVSKTQEHQDMDSVDSTDATELQEEIIKECPSSKNPEHHGKGNVDSKDVIEVQKEFINNIGLTSYFPEKISLQTAMENSSGKQETLADLPWHFLTKMLMLDYRGRDDIISDKIKKDLNIDKISKDDGSMDDCDRMIAELTKDFSSCNSDLSAPHPLDVLITVFRCSSNVVRQILCEKMFMCKLSIPFILPPLVEEKSLFLLWFLRNIILEMKDTNGVICKNSVVKTPTAVVSCLRLGEISRSKSKFLNDVLNCHSHPTFYHRDCKNGMNNRLLSDGLIEAAWHLPSKKTVSLGHLDENVVFLNLRGDGISQDPSKRFMCQVSNVVLVIVDICALGKQNVIDNLRNIASNDAELALLITKQSNEKFSAKNREDLKNCLSALKCGNFEKGSVILDFNANGEKNIEVMKEEAVTKLSQCLAKKSTRRVFESFGDISKLLHVSVDENTLECSAGHKMASDLVKKVSECSVDSLKTAMLPLQCTPWQEWAILNKEEHRREKKGGDDLQSYMNRIYNDKNEKRQEQIRLMKESHTLLDTFRGHLLSSRSEERLYYLKWIKLYLDDMSREKLPGLQMECSAKWNQIRQYKEGKGEMVKLSDLQIELTTMEKKLADSSFGLEHFIREITQAYEAAETLEEKGSEMYNRTVDLPRIMAELMLHGYPLELMDGDAAHVPLTWIKAVLEQLRGLIGDKKIFVLSVLGIQSSGKSTMLNTMFGLQFAVAAGRCTRGVYAQLVPTCKEYSNGKCDYILVVDTEGLRAAELGREKLQHDNEIATLVVGLGDVTLVNIKGENVSEIEDVLQIVIHALLKMKLVNKELDLHSSCFFIHQNVPAPDAAQQLRSGQQKFIDTLDRVTKVAGKQEDAPQFTKFSELIDFDINTNISYFSDLWRGDPPMAPANPGYSENVSKVKQILLTDIMEGRASHLTIGKFCTKLKDLWNGILKQNFVFSFKNNLEMEAYSSLEDKLADILWSLKKAGMEWQSDKENEIVSSERETEELRNSLGSECHNHLVQIYNAAKEKLKNIFETNEDHSIVEQWRSRTFQKLENCFSDIRRNTTEAIELKLKARQIQIDQRNDINMYQVKFKDEAKELAKHLRESENGQKLDDEKLKEHFDEKWEDLIATLPKIPKNNINIEDRVNKVLREKFYLDTAMLNNALQYLQSANSDTIHSNFGCATDKYISIGVFSRVFKDRKKTLRDLREKLFADIRSYFEQNSYPDLTVECAQRILRMADDMLSKIKTSGVTISEEEKFRICIVTWTYQYACFEYSSKRKVDLVTDEKYKLSKFGIHPYFEQELFARFPNILSVISEPQHKVLNKFMIKLDEHAPLMKRTKKDILYAESVVNQLYDDVRKYVDKRTIKDFREESVEVILKMVVDKIDKDFTKTCKIQLAVHICYFTLPTFCEKHKRYIDDTNPRKVFKRDYYKQYFQLFKDSYHRIANETTLSLLFCEHLTKSIEQAVDKDMARELADDVRNNVAKIRNKPAFLKALLCELLVVDNFEEFLLYLENTNTCFEKWISIFINNYLFPDQYSEIASRMIASLLSKVCEEISVSRASVSEEMKDTATLNQWIREFHGGIKEKLPIPLQDLLSLVYGYDIMNLDSFTENLQENLQTSVQKLRYIFHQHTKEHLSCAHENSVYEIIFQGCKGCTEKCPFCSSPCTLNSEEHIKDTKIKHMAKEHYPQACGRYRWEDSGKLAVENCSTDVAGECTFKNNKTNDRCHPYKNYQQIYPDWNIDPDPSVEASPYWKWFLVKYESQLADRYGAKRPDIPSSWKKITKDMAKESAMKFTSSS